MVLNVILPGGRSYAHILWMNTHTHTPNQDCCQLLRPISAAGAALSMIVYLVRGLIQPKGGAKIVKVRGGRRVILWALWETERGMDMSNSLLSDLAHFMRNWWAELHIYPHDGTWKNWRDHSVKDNLMAISETELHILRKQKWCANFCCPSVSFQL